MPICICYVHGRLVYEQCVTVVEVKELDAASLTVLIQTALAPFGLDPINVMMVLILVYKLE